MVLGLGSTRFLRYKAFYEVKGVGDLKPTSCQYHWKHLILRNKNIYGLWVGI